MNSGDSGSVGREDRHSILILVVDDEALVRRLATSMLERLGFDVVAAADGTHAIELYRENRNKVQLVVLDMMMPGMGGHECFLELKAINPEVRVLLSSGYGREGEAQKILDDGVKGFVQKPYRFQEFSEAVEAALKT